jgi:hypothetical protein
MPTAKNAKPAKVKRQRVAAEGGFQAEGKAVARGEEPHDPAAASPPNTKQLFDASNIELQRRMRFNPLRMLDPERLSLALDNFQIGILRDAAMLWEAMVQRDDTLITVKNHLEESIASKDWGVFKRPNIPESQEVEASRHAACLQYFYDHVVATDAFDRNERGGKERLIKHVMRADSYYYCAQHFAWKPEPGKMVDVEGADAVPVISAEVEYVPLWYFENTSGTLRFLPFGGFGITGEEMNFDGEWMVTVGRGVMFAACIAYMFKRLTFQDWTIYNERYAQNKVVGMTTASEESPQGQAMADVVAKFNSDMGLVFYECAAADKPPISLLGPQGTTSVDIFEKFLQRQDSKITVMYRGSDLSMMSRGGKGEKPTGASLQGDETDRMETACCRMVQGSLNYYVDRQVIKYCFGDGVEPLAYFGLPDMDVEDSEEIRESAGFLADRGVRVNAASIADRLGIELAGDREDALEAVGTASGDPEAQTQEETADVRDAMREDFSANSATGRAALVLLDKIEEGLRTANGTFNPGEHPRDEKGQFAALPLVSIPDEQWTGTRKELSAKANALMKTFGPETHPHVGLIHFTSDGRGETLHRQNTAHDFQAVKALPEIARRGKWMRSEPDNKGRQGVVAFHHIEARLRIGQTPYHAQLITKETEDGTVTRHKFYLHRIK